MYSAAVPTDNTTVYTFYEDSYFNPSSRIKLKALDGEHIYCITIEDT